MSRELDIARSALEAAAGILDQQMWWEGRDKILALDPAAIVAGVGEDEAAAEINRLTARVAELEGLLNAAAWHCYGDQRLQAKIYAALRKGIK